MSTDDRGRYAVRFSGEITKAAIRALRAGRMGTQHTDSFFGEPIPYSTTVVLRASSEADAVEQVRTALADAGDYAGFEARALAPVREDPED
jgi:hypothetical protein